MKKVRKAPAASLRGTKLKAKAEPARELKTLGDYEPFIMAQEKAAELRKKLNAVEAEMAKLRGDVPENWDEANAAAERMLMGDDAACESIGEKKARLKELDLEHRALAIACRKATEQNQLEKDRGLAAMGQARQGAYKKIASDMAAAVRSLLDACDRESAHRAAIADKLPCQSAAISHFVLKMSPMRQALTAWLERVKQDRLVD